MVEGTLRVTGTLLETLYNALEQNAPDLKSKEARFTACIQEEFER